MALVSAHADERDELAALRDAAIKRAQGSAWNAKMACDRFPTDSCANGEHELEFARRQLDDADRNLKAARDYAQRYDELMKSRGQSH
jgi:hypothetical protein